MAKDKPAEVKTASAPAKMTAGTSALERQAELVAADVLPDAIVEGDRGMDLVTIITMVISIFQTIIQNCPLSPLAQAKALRGPSVRQKAALLKTVKDHCDCCTNGRHTNAIYRSMLARGSILSDADAAALVEEGSDDSNLLI